MESLRVQLKVLSKKHTMEIIAKLVEENKYIVQISQEMGIPFTTVLQRINELNRAGLVELIDRVDPSSKRAIKEVKLINFRIEISPRNIQQLINEKKKGFKIV